MLDAAAQCQPLVVIVKFVSGTQGKNALVFIFHAQVFLLIVVIRLKEVERDAHAIAFVGKQQRVLSHQIGRRPEPEEERGGA